LSSLCISVIFLSPLFVERASASIILNWAAPATNTDGSQLTDLAGFKLYFGTGSPCNIANAIDVGYVISYAMYLADGTYCFALTAYDSQGYESDFSNFIYRTETETYIDSTLTCANPRFKISSGAMYDYPSIQTAYDPLRNGAVLKIRAGDYNEHVALKQSKTVAIDGGYLCDFSAQPGFSVIHGSLTIGSGLVNVDRLMIK
jgi:hypothetical protein